MTLEIVVAQPALLRVGRAIVDRDGRACSRLEATARDRPVPGDGAMKIRDADAVEGAARSA